jgi:hypothetical protein
MSRSAKTPPLEWADGTYEFALRWGELSELQEVCGAGPFVVLARLAGNQWLTTDISATIRLGLIGGGIEPTKALRLVKDYVESRPPMENASFARGILEVALMGAPEESPGEAPAAPEKASD